MSVFFYKFDNGHAKYLFKANDVLNEIRLTSFDEIFSNNIKMSTEFLEFLEKKLLKPLIVKFLKHISNLLLKIFIFGLIKH